MIVAQQLYMGRAVTGLSVALVIAFMIWLRRPPQPDWQPGRLLMVYAIGIVVQLTHFIEEWTTGFASEFPAVVGLNYTWSDERFVTFNVAWLLAFAGSAWGLHRRWTGALVALWFFAIVAVANGVLHVAMTVLQGWYFPGVVTAPILFVIGVVLLRRLVGVTAGPRSA